ncbi:MAG TPA: Hsp20/alpha crystallin family protein [Syntrophorhabdaceae bacterium]|jgi:HSP20 family molecular chaperone IbpA
MADTEIKKKESDQPERVERTRAGRIYNPDVDIIEKKDNIVVVADMAGVDESSVDITLEKNVLTIYGKVNPDLPGKMRLAYAEYGVGDYQRVFTISGEIDREKIEARVKDGVLKVILPKSEAMKTRKIEVRSGD